MTTCLPNFLRGMHTSPTTQQTRPPGTRNARARAPRHVERVEERLVRLDGADLTGGFRIFLERPVGRRRDDQMNRFVLDMGQVAGIALSQRVRGPVEGRRPRGLAKTLVGRPQYLKILGRVVPLRQRDAPRRQGNDLGIPRFGHMTSDRPRLDTVFQPVFLIPRPASRVTVFLLLLRAGRGSGG